MKKLLYIFILIYSASFSQEEKFTAEAINNELLIGEPTQIKFELSFPASIAIDEISFPNFKTNDTLGNNWELWNIDTIKIQNFDNGDGEFITQITQNIEIANFDTGRYEFPPMIATIQNRNIKSAPISFNIKSVNLVDDQTINNIKDIKLDPLNIFDKLRNWFEKYWHLILGIFLIVSLLLLIYKKVKTKKEIVKIQEPKIPIPIILLEKLKEIEKQKLWQKGKYKLYFTKINSVGWEFIEYRYNIATFEKTSIEILSSLKLTSINQNWIASLEKLFTISDLVKFAKQIPTEQENIFAIQTIREFIENERNDLLNTETKE
ncbi:MAG: hypothetical protein P8M12_08050 [Flavobacteriales bacterium]|nr:hypothetical protein [Flavobacteriales bacterium]